MLLVRCVPVAFFVVRVYGFLLCAHRQTLLSKGDSKAIGIELLKVTYNHLQLLSVMIFFDVKWPSTIVDFFGGLQAISTGGSEALGPSCLLMGGVNRTGFSASLVQAWGSPTYVRSFMTGLTPLVASAILSLFWRLRSPLGRCLRRTCCPPGKNRTGKKPPLHERVVGWLVITQKQVNQRERVSILVLLFITHLAMVQGALSMFICREVVPFKAAEAEDGKLSMENVGNQKADTCYQGATIQYLEADPTVRCWEAGHPGWTFGLGLPMMIGYGLGIPLGAFSVLHHRRYKLDAPKCRSVYGFLYVIMY